MIDVTETNFEAEVLAASMSTPVLVDFWASWCGPCKTLDPILKKLETDYGGRFRLVKIDSDAQQPLAAAFGIRSIPTCILMVGGKPVDGFMGALPESQVRAFLDQHLPSEDALVAEAEAQQASELLAEGDIEAALASLAEALALNPANDDARFEYVRLLIQYGDVAQAAAALAPKLSEVPLQLRFDALRHWLNAIEFVATHAAEAGAMAEFDAKIAANKRDFDARFGKSRLLLVLGQWTAAMDELLEIIMRDKKWNAEAPRKTLVAILELLTPAQPRASQPADGKSAGGIELSPGTRLAQDPQLELVSRYRRKLAMTLN